MDAAAALFMGFDPKKIPIVARAFGLPSLPITDRSLADLRVLLDGVASEADQLPARFEPYRPPSGWRGHIEHGRGRREQKAG